MTPRGFTSSFKKALLSGAFGAFVFFSAGGASGQSQVLDLPTPSIAPPPFTGEFEQAGKRAFWRAGKTRWFFASSLEVGNLFVRGGGALGYGKPHWSWVGVEGSSAISPGGGVTYGGLRLAWPYADLRAGARYAFTASQHFLLPQHSYTREDLEHTDGPKLRYVTLEAELAAGYPLFRGAIFGVAGIYHIVDPPPGYYVFDPTLQIVAKPSLMWRARAGYLVTVDKWDQFRVGAVVEVLGSPERDLVSVRAGPSVTALITHHLEAFGTALLLVHSRDTIGTAGAQFGELGFRYRFATGDRYPEFP
ncbi:MAG: hypothetical protein IPK82_35440 [Polyangiaceae bacterium]|nr:hypothetical protein [Polyangiaceae bacterium]